jgi:uncharacterized protein involved in exopolysaccharide biosynthesis
MDLRFYFSRFLRRAHWFVLLLAIGSAIGLTLARILPTVYVAEATLLVESEQIPDDLAASTVRVQAVEQLQIIQQRILTRDTLIEMANRLQVYAAEGQGTAQTMSGDEIVADMRKRISIVTTGGTATRRSAPEATLVSVSFEAPTAALAAVVANDVVTLILKEDVAMRTGTARQTLEFFEQEVARLDAELARRDAEILAFKEKNRDSLPDSLEFRRNQQAAAQERLLELNRQQAEIRDRRDRLVRLHEATGSIDDGTPTAQQTPEQRQLQSLRDALKTQLVILSPENPKIKMLEAQIAALEKVVAEQVAGGSVDATGRQLSAYEIQLADMDGQLAYLEEQKKQVQAVIDSLQVSLEATPSNAVVLETMQRDYDNIRSQYNEAVAKKARAETGDTIEALARGQRISVIEQAVAPREPSRPNRPAVAAGGVAGGLGLGLGLIALLEALQGSIRRPADLTAALGITPFATLPYIITRGERRRRILLRLALVLLVAGALAAGLWAVDTYYQPLDLLLEQVLKTLNPA